MEERLWGHGSPAHVECLAVNKGLGPLSLGRVVVGSLAVSLQASVVLLFVCGFLALRFEAVSPSLFLLLVSSVSLLALVLVAGPSTAGTSAAALAALLYVLTPVLAALARSVSDDTVAVAAGLLLLLHLASHDYFAATRQFRALVSTNAGLLSAIFLCSRLAAYPQVFAVVLLGLLVFALWPMLLARLQAVSGAETLLGVAAPFVVTLLLFALLSRHHPESVWTAYVFAGAICFVSGVAPIVFYFMQPLKQVLTGQWTEAHI